MKGQKTSVTPEGATAFPPTKLAAGTRRVLVPPGPSASVEALGSGVSSCACPQLPAKVR